MSDHSIIVIILASMKQNLVASVMAQSLDVLMDEYQFGFRGRGGVSRLVFDLERYNWMQSVTEAFSSATDMNTETIEKLAERYRWFAITGSIRIPGRVRLYDLDIISYPTFDPVNPACIMFCIDPSLCHDVYGEGDEFDKDAADVLLRLTVRLAANDQTDGFQMLLVSSLANIKTFDATSLRDSLLQPTPVQDVAKGAGLAHGFITGIKASMLSLVEIGKIWVDGDKFLTLNGFSVLNDLIEINESHLDGDESE